MILLTLLNLVGGDCVEDIDKFWGDEGICRINEESRDAPDDAQGEEGIY